MKENAAELLEQFQVLEITDITKETFFCFENAIIYWNLSSLLFTVAAFTLKKAF